MLLKQTDFPTVLVFCGIKLLQWLNQPRSTTPLTTHQETAILNLAPSPVSLTLMYVLGQCAAKGSASAPLLEPLQARRSLQSLLFASATQYSGQLTEKVQKRKIFFDGRADVQDIINGGAASRLSHGRVQKGAINIQISPCHKHEVQAAAQTYFTICTMLLQDAGKCTGSGTNSQDRLSKAHCAFVASLYNYRLTEKLEHTEQSAARLNLTLTFS